MRYTIRSVQRAQQRPDTAADVAERVTWRDVAAQAHQETMERFPVVTADNFQAAWEFQERRIAELIAARRAQP